MKQKLFFTLGAAILLMGMIGGCKKSDDPVSAQSGSSTVNLSVGFSKITSTLAKTTAADSLRIDSVIVVLQRIKFESSIETAVLDSTGEDSTETEQELEVTFKGPFVIHVRDTSTIDFAQQTLPAGTYDGIKFKIHRLTPGEKHEDSDEHNHRGGMPNDSSFQNHSIVIWGAILKNSSWVPFSTVIDMEIEFKMKGTFIVAESTNMVNMALRFNTADWFKKVDTGALLDPTDSNSMKDIKEAIKKSFEKGKGGRDLNDDGHPDD